MATTNLDMGGTGWDRRQTPRTSLGHLSDLKLATPVEVGSARFRDGRSVALLAIVVVGVIVAWAAATLVYEAARLQMVAPRVASGIEAATACVRLFCATVLFLFAAEGDKRRRLRWVASGFAVLGLGGGIFGYVLPLSGGELTPETTLVASLGVLFIADALFAVGLIPTSPPPFTSRCLAVSVAALVLLSAAISWMSHPLPSLVPRSVDTLTYGGTPWHALAGPLGPIVALSFGLTCVAAVGAVMRYSPSEGIRAWLVLAIVILAGAQLHDVLWPSAYQPVLSSANVLRLISAAVITIGGVFELRRASIERTALLAMHRQHAQRMHELTVLKADFTEMVAHELGSPIAAIRATADVAATGNLSPTQHQAALDTISAEASSLARLVDDVQASARGERDDFVINRKSTPLSGILRDALTHAQSLPGNHPLIWGMTGDIRVHADHDRICQVLRNLLNNAAKYAPDGTPIELRARVHSERI